jgi:hypothetical protein
VSRNAFDDHKEEPEEVPTPTDDELLLQRYLKEQETEYLYTRELLIRKTRERIQALGK